MPELKCEFVTLSTIKMSWEDILIDYLEWYRIVIDNDGTTILYGHRIGDDSYINPVVEMFSLDITNIQLEDKELFEEHDVFFDPDNDDYDTSEVIKTLIKYEDKIQPISLPTIRRVL